METKRLIKKNATVSKLALKGVNPDLFDEFKSLQSSAKYNIQKDYNTYLRHTENNLISDPKKICSYLKNKNINSPDSLFYNKVRHENDGDIGNAFADYFNSVFKSSTDFDGNDECKSNCVGDLVKIEGVTCDDVVLAIRVLKSSLSVGVDNILSFIIKGCAEFLIYPLLVLFNLSLRTKVFQVRIFFLPRTAPFWGSIRESLGENTPAGFMWDLVKGSMYQMPYANMQELKQRIAAVIYSIAPQIQGAFEKFGEWSHSRITALVRMLPLRRRIERDDN
ncbi:hypothetical protein AVEN_205830-1 [Araneus ventricosus]|uniref:Uncharacterized protein n=1 Tax=Araneus ventricosus TaxID=182803 RepID=A0A4Y2HDV7_ARAVE|nr:hypothetical protein AVEN_205830-1 [Araneus ventricosus]